MQHWILCVDAFQSNFSLAKVDETYSHVYINSNSVNITSDFEQGDLVFIYRDAPAEKISYLIAIESNNGTLLFKKTHELQGLDKLQILQLVPELTVFFDNLATTKSVRLNEHDYTLLYNAFTNSNEAVSPAPSSFPSTAIPLPHNRIIYGAPGTGKSYLLKEQMAGKRFDGANTTNPTPLFVETNYERVTFYPNYTYGQFFGTYKPKKAYKNMEPYITYEFVPGPFFRLLLRALESKQQGQPENFLLIIEEINRANAAAVFGDVFQLLDRNDTGESEYGIKLSEDALQFISENHTGLLSNDELKIPDNFYIWTTMNNADQGVQPLDSAFKRRFDFEYIGINDNEAAIQSIPVQLPGFSGPIDWNSFRKTLNKFLLQSFSHIKEDKLIGPFFIKKSVLDSAKFDDAFKNKLLMYLSDDVLKTADKTKLFKVSSFSELIELHRKNEQLFSDEFYTELVNEITLTPQRSQPDDRFTPDTEEDE